MASHFKVSLLKKRKLKGWVNQHFDKLSAIKLVVYENESVVFVFVIIMLRLAQHST